MLDKPPDRKPKMREIPQPEGGRVETGVVQFDGDWPGIFIRGDNALIMAHYLKVGPRDPLNASRLKGLIELLDSCDARKLYEKPLEEIGDAKP